MSGYYNIVQLLIQKGIDVNQKVKLSGQNALHFASREGHKEIVELLIQKRIDINETDNNGESALHKASKNGHQHVVEFLICL
jgi:ankyrin repeat protein